MNSAVNSIPAGRHKGGRRGEGGMGEESERVCFAEDLLQEHFKML